MSTEINTQKRQEEESMINTENKKAAKQMVHEAEITRQHARYKIPAKIEIEGKKYKLLDWSVSGCAVEGLPDQYCKENICRKAKIIFQFDDFITIVDNVDIDFVCEKRKVGEGNTKYGGRFHNLNDAQLAILNQILTAYLNGDILTEDDILHAVTKQITYPKKIEKKIDRKKTDKLLLLIYFTIVVLIGFLLFVAYQRLFIVQTVNGYIDANLTTVRSPYPSYIDFVKPLHKGDKVDTNETLALAYFIGGGVQPIHAATEGTVYKVNVLEHQFRNTAEPICMVLPKDTKPYIVTHMEHTYFKKVSVGDVAKVRLADGTIMKARITDIQPAEAVSLEHTKILANIYNQARNYDIVTLKPFEPLDPKLINTSVFVTIDTLLQ
jgi:alginate biosynthesis protein Alg44